MKTSVFPKNSRSSEVFSLSLGPRLTFEVQATSEVVDMVVLALSGNGVEIGSSSLVKPRKNICVKPRKKM